ncbi:hypothetical protein [Streptomyces sp. PBH53]|uniref:hypothetical protein n=1 Tax=Streptomyces sp. PBH53 TaxID=1577075 RepID=UPI001AD84BC7|nr:hypothetical protein [Streptomyces sp. PBH53]
MHRLTIHHRVNRGMGGAREPFINQAHNLLLVCTTCNGWFEDHPRESYEAGWKVRRPQLPEDVEVGYFDGRVYRLSPDGARTTVVEAGRRPQRPDDVEVRSFDGSAFRLTADGVRTPLAEVTE